MIAVLIHMIDDFQDGKSGPKWNTYLLHFIYSYDIGPGIVFFRIKSDLS